MPDPILRAVGVTLPDAPYPETTAILGFRFGLDYRRIEQADTWNLAPAELRPWLLMLWFRSWQQIPAGAFIDDDAVIAARIGMPLGMFQLHRPALLRGWYRAADGRLYHPVIADMVRERIDWRRKETERKEQYRMSRGTDAGQVRDDACVPRDTYVGATDTGAGAGAGAGGKALRPKVSVNSRRPVHATRLDPRWQLPDAWQEWAVTVHGMEATHVVRVSLAFRDYWIGVPGAKGRKLDWQATWRNWIRKECGE